MAFGSSFEFQINSLAGEPVFSPSFEFQIAFVTSGPGFSSSFEFEIGDAASAVPGSGLSAVSNKLDAIADGAPTDDIVSNKIDFFVDGAPNSSSVSNQVGLSTPEAPSIPLEILNLGPRIKQIRRIRNDTLLPGPNDVLGAIPNKTDWVAFGALPDSVIPSVAGGRLAHSFTTLAPGDLITGEDQAVAGQSYISNELWYAPYRHNIIALYDGSKWNYHQFDNTFRRLENVSVENGFLSANTNYDAYVYNNNGTLGIEYIRWIGGTVRDPSWLPVQQDGVWVGDWDRTRRYVGTVRVGASNGVESFFTGSAGFRRLLGIWNVQNQVWHGISGPISISSVPAFNTTLGYTLINGQDTPQSFVVGMKTPFRYSFTLRIQLIAIGTPATISQIVPNYRSRAGGTVAIDSGAGINYDKTVGWRPLDKLGSTTVSQDRVMHHSKSMLGLVLDPGHHQIRHYYNIEDIIVSDSGMGAVDLSGSFEFEILR